MGQSSPSGKNYSSILEEYERNLRNAQSKGNRGEIDHWEKCIEGLRQEARNRGIYI